MYKYPLIFLAIFLTSCSTRKQVRNAGPAKQPAKVIGGNVLVRSTSALQYIEKFKGIAVDEMNKNGIPASITLAQGLLESGNGNGSLAREANNHFGIKCNTDWKGPTILKDDDAAGECFRVYANAEESFKDHSVFLKRKRYSGLFELNRDDYKGWANGLKQAGYATNPRYSELLVDIVERYGLDQYDREETSIIAKEKREEKVQEEIAGKTPAEVKSEPEKAPVAMKIYEVKPGDTLYSISKRYTLTVEEIKILNGLENNDLKLGQLLLVSK